MAVPLVQLTRAAPTQGAAGASFSPSPVRKPGWLKVKAPGGPTCVQLKGMMRELGRHTVCEEARCPNIGECWEHKAATFMILRDLCTRNCTYCAVAHGTPRLRPAGAGPLGRGRGAHGPRPRGHHLGGPGHVPNGGAEAFAGCVTEIRRRLPDTTVEVLIPDSRAPSAPLRRDGGPPDILDQN